MTPGQKRIRDACLAVSVQSSEWPEAEVTELVNAVLDCPIEELPDIPLRPDMPKRQPNEDV